MICEKDPVKYIKLINDMSISEMIENIPNKFEANKELCKQCNLFLDKFIYNNQSLLDNEDLLVD